MWTIEDIEALNPIEVNQSKSFFQHILDIGAANEKLLCETSSLLEQRGSPYVAAFTQLPFPIACPGTFITVPGSRENILVDLTFNTASVTFDLSGQLAYVSLQEQKIPESEVAYITQITAIIRLWQKRARLHKIYLNCISPLGFRNEIIGCIENWMDMPEAKMALPIRRHAPLTAQAFQAEIARRIRIEINHAVNNFLQAYSIANLEEIPITNRLYGYFAMTAPGRLACAAPPIPIVSGLCSRGKPIPNTILSIDHICNFLDKQIPFENRVLAQLMAMHRLLQQGEPELALIGCVTAIEWFLNERFAHLVRRSKSGQEISASISLCLRSGVLDFLTDQDKERLMELSLARNAIVHGAPPKRTYGVLYTKGREFVVDKDFIKDSLYLALNIYRAVNLNNKNI